MSTKTKPKIDYKKELESASKGMILIHDPKLLIKLIVRMIVSKLRIKHAGMVLYEPQRDTFVLSISRGERGTKIPAGFARFDKNNALIRLFAEEEYQDLPINRNALMIEDLNKMIWHESLIEGGNGAKELLLSITHQMQMLDVVVCVPAYYQDHLLAILLLGTKKDEGKFDEEELDFFSALASDAAMAIRNAQLFTDLKKESDRNRNLFIQITSVLGSTIEAKDKCTHGHTERVTNYSLAIAHQMIGNGSANFSPSFLENLYIASLLHDIGKIGIPESILNKPDELSEEERILMEQHTLRGVEILSPLASEFKEIIDALKYHHERYDGKGYPEGLMGEQIPMIAAIITVADTFDAIATDRPYRKGLNKEIAIEEIRKNIGKQFHPFPAQAMIELYEARGI